MNELYLGIDLGGTKMLAALVDGNGTIVARTLQPTMAERGVEDVIDRLISMADSLLSRHAPEAGKAAIRGIGIAVAGVLDPDQGTVVLATNLGWKNVPIGRLLEERFRCPVRVLNDANAAALGEWLAGAGAGSEDVVFVTVSTGIGGGIVSGGRLILGSSGSAGELGHISIDRNGPPCPCGNRGCVELYASGSAIARRVREDVRGGDPRTSAILRKAGFEAERLTAQHVAAAAEEGDDYARNVLADAGSALGMGLVSIIHLANPNKVILGGGVTEIGDLLLAPMMETLRKYGIPEMVNQVAFDRAQLEGDAGAAGAALWWKYERMPVARHPRFSR
ncbi:ROK family protein [Cohnella sp. CFH 77786]|uniref:ROK family protein n=1 Tax=Cohnella sp. CFH 77786 TaxID=2662265 RepID=UPI001C60D1D3|nr:ROK family protein [Cohnella sp. CFH 77786]